MLCRINCRKNDQGAWCKDKRTKRSLMGIGARICKVAEGENCEYQDKYPRPKPPAGCSNLNKE